MVRWYSVKVFERDERIDEFLKLTDEKKAKIEPIIKKVEETLDDDAEVSLLHKDMIILEQLSNIL